jgi:hypothetical protein
LRNTFSLYKPEYQENYFLLKESLEELEARMYSEVYHDANVENISETTDNLPPNYNKQPNRRYWQKSKNLYTQKVSLGRAQ